MVVGAGDRRSTRGRGRDQTALHIACGLGHVGAAEALLKAGADREAPSPFGTPREIATKEGKPEVLALLDRPFPR